MHACIHVCCMHNACMYVVCISNDIHERKGWEEEIWGNDRHSCTSLLLHMYVSHAHTSVQIVSKEQDGKTPDVLREEKESPYMHVRVCVHSEEGPPRKRNAELHTKFVFHTVL